MKQVICPYCEQPAELVGGKEIYPDRHDLHGRGFYRCVPCDARVGTHRTTGNPMGRMANKALRALKVQAHQALNPLYQTGDMTRTEAYRWLARELLIPRKDCHIGQFDERLCERTISRCMMKASE